MKNLKDDQFREIHDFYRLVKVNQNSEIVERSELKKDKFSKGRLRQPLVVSEKVLVYAKSLRKKDASENLNELTTQNISFFNRDRKFIIRKRLKIFDSPLTYYSWIADENIKKLIDKRHIREELFVINN